MRALYQCVNLSVDFDNRNKVEFERTKNQIFLLALLQIFIVMQKLVVMQNLQIDYII